MQQKLKATYEKHLTACISGGMSGGAAHEYALELAERELGCVSAEQVAVALVRSSGPVTVAKLARELVTQCQSVSAVANGGEVEAARFFREVRLGNVEGVRIGDDAESVDVA